LKVDHDAARDVVDFDIYPTSRHLDLSKLKIEVPPQR